MRKRPFSFFLKIAVVMLFLVPLSSCDNWNTPIKEKMEFYRAMTPANNWEELKELVEHSDAELIALTKSFPAGTSSITVHRPVTISAVPDSRAVITRTSAFTGPFFTVAAGGALTLGRPAGGGI
jgi:hypothetical protein